MPDVRPQVLPQEAVQDGPDHRPRPRPRGPLPELPSPRGQQPADRAARRDPAGHPGRVGAVQPEPAEFEQRRWRWRWAEHARRHDDRRSSGRWAVCRRRRRWRTSLVERQRPVGGRSRRRRWRSRRRWQCPAEHAGQEHPPQQQQQQQQHSADLRNLGPQDGNGQDARIRHLRRPVPRPEDGPVRRGRAGAVGSHRRQGPAGRRSGIGRDHRPGSPRGWRRVCPGIHGEAFPVGRHVLERAAQGVQVRAEGGGAPAVL
mmetsp:Transcript_17854/g.51115  ORF Transcript_17854/g.51115 Transcript_17854/m.51115 type:complete len:258 (+) Transcript_17854:490-1263(+)